MGETVVDTEIARETRTERKRKATRARLLQAAHAIMSEVGVEDAKIKDITDAADIGFGTFYNYFSDKDDLAAKVLDCVIDDCGRRNVLATKGLRQADPALVMPVSMRLVMREAVRTPVWQWWIMRPDLLYDRMRKGFGPFGKRDMRDAIARDIFRLEEASVEQAWPMSIWMMIGGIHDILIGQNAPEREAFVVESIMRMMGVEHREARRVSSTQLPAYPAAAIDWSFELLPEP